MAKSAEPETIKDIRRLASDPEKVMVTKTVEYDLLASNLTKCDEIARYVDSGARVKLTILHGTHAGQTAYEMKPRIDGRLFYIKVTFISLSEPEEYMLLISAHPDH